ncbi:hypothetical protein DMH18_35135 [Streptomyces sp. WAC 06783]|uniref:hypothetical protein n=1 Tax=Streptomyces sp. WAC 06783 TaxID=2203211 RepID=UPI000F74A425|nr:hypothetical protein [Streptomyces sp. WAC 06783]RSO04267.1 hypothetical protein DMH18_35135 [Streptomyces sp. WAC 06783]
MGASGAAQVYGAISRTYAELATALSALHTVLAERRPVQELVERVEERRLRLSVAVGPTAMPGPEEVADVACALIGAIDAFVVVYRELAVLPRADESVRLDAVRERVAGRRADAHACLSNFSAACRNVLLRQGDS